MSLGRVLITGGAGTVGSAIADAVVRAGAAEVIVFDQMTRGRPENLRWAVEHGPVQLVAGDIRDRDAVADVMAGISVVFHQAAIRITQCAEEPRLAHEVLVDGTFNVAEAAVSAGVGKVVLASSAAVYGEAAVLPTPESHDPYGNRTLYGVAKTFAEGLFRSLHESAGLDYVALRYFNVYGPRMDIHSQHTEVLVRWIERIAAGHPPVIFGTGRDTVDLVYVDDVARANVLAAERPVSDAVFNVGSGVETSLDELARMLLRVMGSSLDLVYGPDRGVNAVPRKLADTSRAAAILGFTPSVSLADGLDRLVRWWQSERPSMARAGA